MYDITVLPHGALTPAGNPAISLIDREFQNASLIKVVFPFTLVSEFDNWLADTIQPIHVEKPIDAINEYSDPDSGFAEFIDQIYVIYYAVVDDDKLEEVEKFADSYKDIRG